MRSFDLNKRQRPAGDGKSARATAQQAGPRADRRPSPTEASQLQLSETLNRNPRVVSQMRQSQALGRRFGPTRTVLQAKWVDADEGLQKWDSLRGGLQWFYDPLTDKLFYITGGGERSPALTYQGWLERWLPGPSEEEMRRAVEAGEAREFTDKERELWKRNMMAQKGREYSALTEEAVSTRWEGVRGRQEWDTAFDKEYASFLTFDDMKPHEASGQRRQSIQIATELKRIAESGGNEGRLREFHERYKGEMGLPEWEVWKKAISAQLPELARLDPYDVEQNFKVGWKAPVVINERLRQERKPHGSYTGTLNLGKGILVASGSFRDRDPLNQNEIIYQLWKNAHAVNGLDFWDDRQFMPLRTIVRHNVVNEQLRPVFDQLGEGTFRPGQPEFDLLLSTPNVRAVLFLVKDRGAELGIRGIRSITLAGGSATIQLEQGERRTPREYRGE